MEQLLSEEQRRRLSEVYGELQREHPHSVAARRMTLDFLVRLVGWAVRAAVWAVRLVWAVQQVEALTGWCGLWLIRWARAGCACMFGCMSKHSQSLMLPVCAACLMRV